MEAILHLFQEEPIAPFVVLLAIILAAVGAQVLGVALSLVKLEPVRTLRVH